MKRLLLSFVLVALTTSLFAQLPISLGIKGSINSTKITTDNAIAGASSYTLNDLKADAANGFNVGAFLRLKHNKVFLQPELLYSVQKGKTTFDGSNLDPNSTTDDFQGAVTQHMDVKSIQVPILLGVKVLDLKVASVNLMTGPAMSFILNGSEISFNKQSGVAVDPSLYDPNNFKNNTWDWQLGAGVDVAMLSFDVRYAWALTNVSEGVSNNDPTVIGFKNKGNSLILSLGIRLF
ncbi:porin family protein [Prolixibacter sp. NT017]|uniref:porin family protein n=1 Tax=Prolixibacter sp. NT017 TaxID=2652390 RepID=UPI001285F7B8|nr:porin family protein [Prolixibacter sp. NT017]GET25112.1 hypothetical protein NT017_14410 [Prolixibacter sp. NT017]